MLRTVIALKLYFFSLPFITRMSRRRIVGYNRNNDNSITQIIASGTKLISTDNEVMILPAGYGILEIEVRKTTDSDFSGDADQLILYLVSRKTLNRIDIVPVSKMEINYNPKITIKPDLGQKFIKNIIPEEDDEQEKVLKS